MSPRESSICVSLCEQTIQSLEAACSIASDSADVIELRLDCLNQDELSNGFDDLNQLLRNSKRPTVVTLRPAEQGGRRELTLDFREHFWALNQPSTFLDVEFDLVRSTTGFLDWNRVICSYHNFDRMPDANELASLYDQMAATPARILKIALPANDVIDCLPVFDLLERARKHGREIIAIAMGDAGLATRILGPSRGAFLTYAAADNENPTAPGQVTVGDLRDLYRIQNIHNQTAIYGLIGRPVSHSLSPRIHNGAFVATGIDAVYIPFEVNDAASFLKRMVHPATREISWNLRGLSVTAPLKYAVMDHLDWIDPIASEIGAVNTIIVDGQSLQGFNTDALGFLSALLDRFQSLEGFRCAVIGAGGAANAVVWALRQQGAEVTIFARSESRAALLASKYGVAYKQLAPARFAGFDIVVNATQVGTTGFDHEPPIVNAEQLREARLAYDLVYNPTETRFLIEASKAGCQTLGGIDMFIAQAAEQFKLWTGCAAPEETMRSAVAHLGIKQSD